MTQSIEYIKGSDGTGNANLATVQSTRSALATTIIVDTVEGINPGGFAGSMGTPHSFTDPVTSEVITVISDATAVDFTGHVDGSNLAIDTIAPGYTDEGSAVGDIVIIKPTTQYADNLAEVIAESHNDDGSLSPAGIHQAVPAGSLLAYAGSLTPTGFLTCDGSSQLRATYPDLFTAIGTNFGSADSTHFNLPDMRGRAAVGVGTGTWLFTFPSTSVNTSTDQITVTANEELITGRKLQLTTTGTLPTGLSLATDYYIIVIDSTHIQLAANRTNAVQGVQIDITGAGSGTNTATHTGTARTLGEHGGEEDHTLIASEEAALLYTVGTSAGSNFADFLVGTSGASTQGMNTNAGNTAHNNMPPFLGLNYIIKI